MKCEHPNCRCNDATVELEGKKFCSEKCAESRGESDASAGCRCGHPDCAAL